LQNASRKLMDEFNPKAAAAIPSIFLIGDRDPFACNRTTEHFARSMGADIAIANGAGHYPMKDAPEILEQFIRRVNICVNEQKKIEYITAQQFWDMQSRPAAQPTISAVDSPLGGFRGALQGVTGFLNPPARILQ
jgi:hypothetical protein